MNARARRLFFALWPSSAMRGELVTAARATLEAIGPARRVPVANLHLTLAFLGSLEEGSLSSVREAAAECASARGAAREPLQVSFDQIDWWRRAQIVCAVAARPERAAADLADALRRALTLRGFAPDLKPFHAHVTLARHVRHGPRHRPLAPVVWRFEEFALVESRTEAAGALYSVVERWSLYSTRGA